MAQNPDAIDNARSIAKSLQQKQANDSNAALDAAGVPTSGQAGGGRSGPGGEAGGHAGFPAFRSSGGSGCETCSQAGCTGHVHFAA